MSKNLTIRPNRTIRENAEVLVPFLFDEFFTLRKRVLGHPRLKERLHQMRLAGKSLRYVMETLGSAYGDSFNSCLKDLKQLLVKFGKIHDCDMHIPKLQDHLKEVRLFNRMVSPLGKEFSTKELQGLIRFQKELRDQLFGEITVTLQQWDQENFRVRLMDSLSLYP